MATLAEYFYADFKTTFTVHGELEFFTREGASVGKAIPGCHMDANAAVRFVSFLVSEESSSLGILRHLAVHPEKALAVCDGITMSTGHPAADSEDTPLTSLPFSSRIFLYVDRVLGEDEKSQLRAQANEAGFRLEIRDQAYSKYRSYHEVPRAFISHDSRDKADFVRDLADHLRRMLCPVWYDEYSLQVGDSLRESIDRGLRDCGKCIVVLSPNYMNNPGWAAAEFDAIVTKHNTTGKNTILPVWHNVSQADVANYSPMVASVVGLSSQLGVEEVAQRLLRKISPE
ncbi:toll/interleukin-1 receptor domain-containing protein [Krasilnikovia sp. MM14-A1004]|uniref:toll/interleukin-1 receptor domain-containing protein n=1 Tax=Krasilnikovia sp. MM14-A1004 TaxID=3373541 RepID=UPI00399C5BD9